MMQEHDVQILKGAAVPTAVVGAVVVIVGAGMAGTKGAIGAVAAFLLVAVFFTVGVVVLGWASRTNPMALMNVAIFTYLVKVAALFVVLVAFQDTTLFDRRIFGLSILLAAVVWIVGEVRAFSRLKMLYVEPDREPHRGPHREH
jgi:ATP synthase protein I